MMASSLMIYINHNIAGFSLSQWLDDYGLNSTENMDSTHQTLLNEASGLSLYLQTPQCNASALTSTNGRFVCVCVCSVASGHVRPVL